ncbi:hypothetical protein WMQ46_10660 [Vibrio diabolicus]|uniref:hypothetical protein n=1 Tax=Vibrio diabolicus TaxID=50719 RepID=UPI003750DA14
MSNLPFSQIDGFSLAATGDMPDERDLIYRARPMLLDEEMKYPDDLMILDQKSEGACTGFGLAAVINRLNQLRNNKIKVSSRMLYEMARKVSKTHGGFDNDPATLNDILNVCSRKIPCGYSRNLI